MLDEGGTPRIAVIEGRVIGARPGQQIVLYAKSGAWYVQPFTDQPFTKIREDSTWSNSTHLGTEYAALLVEPNYRPPARTDALPNIGEAIGAVAIVRGEAKLLVPAFWQSWWFRTTGGVACLCALLVIHRLRLRQLTRQLNARFEERLDERMRIAQELQDTLLQGILSASMQLHIAVERLPEDLQPKLGHIQNILGQVIEEGQNTVQGLRSITGDHLDLAQAFSRIQAEAGDRARSQVGFRVSVEGQPMPLHPILRDEVYRIGREIVINAFRHSQAKSIEVKVDYGTNYLNIFVRDDGCVRDGQLAGMRERAERFGARLKIRSRVPVGTEIELSVPGGLAYFNQPLAAREGWFSRLPLRRKNG
jgi:signal transduction histidine kinase